MKSRSWLAWGIFAIILVSGCRVGDDDPWLTLRSRDKRLHGIWKFNYQINDSTSSEYEYDIRPSGEIYAFNYKDSPIYYGKWRWITENAELNEKESFIIEYFNFSTIQFFITELRYKKIEAFHIPYATDPNRKYHTTFRRIK